MSTKTWICGWCGAVSTSEAGKKPNDILFCENCCEMSQVMGETDNAYMIDVPDLVKIERGREKRCKCEVQSVVVDKQNHTTECAKCGALLDPFDALCRLAERYERLKRNVDSLKRQAKELDNYKPWRKGIKMIEQMSRVGETVPTCPRCNEPFELAELTHWVNRAFLKNKN